MSLLLHDYWRSGAAYRVRIALNLKGLRYDAVAHDLRIDAHRDPAYRALAPAGLIPALEAGGAVLTQSLAILEYLEEAHPDPALLPQQAVNRAIVRAMAETIACDMHPLHNLRVLNAVRSDLGGSEAQVSAWIARWMTAGFAALEAMITRHGGGFAFGDAPTFADCCIVPALYSADRFMVDLAPYPRLRAAGEAARALSAVSAAHPSRQPDADPA